MKAKILILSLAAGFTFLADAPSAKAQSCNPFFEQAEPVYKRVGRRLKQVGWRCVPREAPRWGGGHQGRPNGGPWMNGGGGNGGIH